VVQDNNQDQFQLILAKMIRLETLFEVHMDQHKESNEVIAKLIESQDITRKSVQKHDYILKACIWVFCTLSTIITAKVFNKI